MKLPYGGMVYVLDYRLSLKPMGLTICLKSGVRKVAGRKQPVRSLTCRFESRYSKTY